MMIINWLDRRLNGVTMYRLVAYGLIFILVGSLIEGAIGLMAIKPLPILVSTAVLLAAGFFFDRLLPLAFNVTANIESSLITCLILALELPPSSNPKQLVFYALASGIAISSKYILAIHHKLLFNPAALAAVILGATGLLPAIWWVGSPAILPLTALFALILLRKIHRYEIFFIFLFAALAVTILLSNLNHVATLMALKTALISSPLVFVGSVMVTEPITLPSTKNRQQLYALLVGLIIMSQLHYSLFYATPEIALIIGNIASYIVSYKRSLTVRLVSRTQLTSQLYIFKFEADHPLKFIPGQYAQWTLKTAHWDRRGNRRSFSIASAPGDKIIELAMRIPKDKPSSFKRNLLAMPKGGKLQVAQPSGDFVLPKNPQVKLAFMAGGVGITPFASMVKTLNDKIEHRDIVLIYSVSNTKELAFNKSWQQATKLGLNLIPLTERIDQTKLSSLVPDLAERLIYLSGPPGFVNSYKAMIKNITKHPKIKTDYFSGY